MHQPDRLISGSRIKACVFVKFGLSWSFVVFKSAPGYASRYAFELCIIQVIKRFFIKYLTSYGKFFNINHAENSKEAN
ncbi:MAG: hypothetical protein CV087_22940 [Candidatus Brocadia sp. WS118]|nr:MAG: hypothetical protein CV087_22940 [Candidatus Brocadia sp. WS118]